MNEWAPFIALAGLLVGLFVWLRQDIREQGRANKEQGEQLRGEIKEQYGQLRQELKAQGDRLGAVEQGLAALKATVETFFRVRVDPPPPPETEPRTGTEG